jgi:hypothetical protein
VKGIMVRLLYKDPPARLRKVNPLRQKLFLLLVYESVMVICLQNVEWTMDDSNRGSAAATGSNK